MGLDYSSADHTYATIFHSKSLFKGFFLREDVVVPKRTEILLGVTSILLKSFPCRCCCRRLPGCQLWTLLLSPRLT